MSKVSLKQKAQILSEVYKKTETKFHAAIQQKDINKAEGTLEQDLLDL